MLPVNLESLKREAKRIRKTEGVTHSMALDKIAKGYGFSSWNLLMAQHSKENSK